MEAIFGAIMTESGFDTAKRVILRLYEPVLSQLTPERMGKDSKTLLQEFLQAHHLGLPEYHVIDVRGAAHDQTFETECQIKKLNIAVRGIGKSRRMAEQAAAKVALSMAEEHFAAKKKGHTMDKPNFRCGYIAVVGRPNVGKSTLINTMIGEKVSITSKKPQTTRNRVLGVVSTESSQFVFVDTPGFQTKHGNALIRGMNRSVRSTLSDTDVVVLLIESSGWRAEDEKVLQLINKDAKNVILVINKVDLMKQRDELLPLMAQSMEKFPFTCIVPVSAEKGRQVPDLMAEIEKLLPENPPFFDPDIYTDKSPRFLASEIIREKAFRLLGDELPYGIAVTIDKWQEESKKAEIIATLIVERDAHKGIVIGAAGEKLREISRLARMDIAEMLGKQVYLEVWVRVRKGWNDDARALKTLGYE